MKRILLIVLIFTGCGKSPTQSTKYYGQNCDPTNKSGLKLQGKKFLIAGQSNAVSPANGEPAIWPQNGLTTINDYYHNPLHFRVPTQSDPNDSGFVWIHLGDLFNQPTFFNIVAHGGTTTRQWVQSFHQEIIDALRAEQYSAVLWVQGESDTGQHLSAEESYQNMKFIIEESKKIQPGIFWFVAQDGHGDLLGKNDTPVRQAQLRIIAEGIAFCGPDIDQLRQDPNNFEPGLGEFKSPGFQNHAQAWFDILKNF